MNQQLMKSLASLSHEELQNIIINIHNTDSSLAQLVAQEISNHDPEALHKLIKKNINALKRSKKNLYRNETDALSHKFDQINAGIEKLMDLESPQYALELCKLIISIDTSIFNRIDDSYGYISHNYYDTYELLNRAFIDAKAEPQSIADYLFDIFSDDEHGVRGYILDYCKTALRDGATEYLEKRIKVTPDLSDFNRKKITSVIADVKQDVDAYIEIIKTECKNENRKVLPHEVTEVAKRLNHAFRGAEAIKWLNSIPDNESFQILERNNLYIEALLLEGETEKARSYLWQMFTKSLLIDNYLSCLKYSTVEQKEMTKREAIAICRSHPDLINSIKFLLDMDELDELDQLIQLRYLELNDYYYSVLRKTSTYLAANDKPLSATLLRRILVDSVLDQAKSKYYPYAISDLKKATEFAHNVNHWGDHVDGAKFIELLFSRHPRKSSFWFQWNELDIQL